MLVLLAQQGDRAALNSLLEIVSPRLHHYIRGILSSEASDAEDVLQETLLRIARKLSWLEEPQAFEGWIYRIASRETYRALSRADRRLADDPIDENLQASDLSLPDAGPNLLSKVLEDVSPASRAVLLLHYEHDRTLEEIAGILTIPLGTVKSRLAYGLKCLREKVEG